MLMQLDVMGLVNALAWMLLGAAVVGMLAWRLRIPYAIALVIGGVLVAQTRLLPLPQLDPSVLLFVLLPPLLFDAAFRLDAEELRSLARPVLLLALPGTLITAGLVGAVLALVLQLPWPVALLFGSIVAATDPVAVIAIFRVLHVPSRLSLIAEGESLINDGVAITLYTVLSEVVRHGSIDVLGGTGLFVREVFGGVAIGAVLGVVFSRATSIIDDHQIEMTLSTALAYGSFLIAQSLGTSGALACVAAGLIHGSYGREVGMSERTRRLLDDLWEYFGFIANALVFLLVGFTTSLGNLIGVAGAVAVAVVAVLAARVLVVLVPPLLLRPRRAITTMPERLVLIWGGLRGALTITLALALPADMEVRGLLIAMAFGVVLFTLVVQGLTLPLLVRRIGLARAS
jgi:CPA1 family monovalent cation:H+ antiporter